MAQFCGKCGTAIQPGSKFCPSCGALASVPVQPTAPPPAPPTAGQPQQQYAPPAYAAPGQPVPPQKSGGALKVILIAVGVIVVLIVIGIVGVGLFIKKAVLDNVSVKEGPGGKAEVTLNTPAGKLKIDSKSEITEEKLGVPIYPGARAEEGAGSISFSGEGDKAGTFGGASFTTTDSVDKVIEFYKGRLGSKVTVLDSTSEGKRSVILNVSAENSWKTIAIEDSGNGTTKIAVSSISGTKPQ